MSYIPLTTILFTATGSTQATAFVLTSAVNVGTTVASGTGAILTGAPTQRVFNRGVNDLLVYPPVGAQIEADGTNTAITIVAGGDAIFIMASSTQFYVSTTSFT